MIYLTSLAAIIVFAYAVSSGLGLWLASKAARTTAGGRFEPPLDQAPAHHRALLLDYATGHRRAAWTVSFALVILTLAGLATGSPVTPWAFGVALAIDSALFLAYPGRRAFVAATTPLERLIDAAQCAALLLAFSILFAASGASA